jgi:hypothetical protein
MTVADLATVAFVDRVVAASDDLAASFRLLSEFWFVTHRSLPRMKTSLRVTRRTTAYKKQPEGYAPDTYELRVDETIFAAVAADKTRMLDGKPIKVVLFTIGTSDWYWMPRKEFLRSTEKVDVKTQTGIPFQR